MHKDVAVQLEDLLNEYNQTVQDATDKSIKAAARESVQKLKNTSPKRPGGGEYAKSWTTKKTSNGVVVYNKRYQLTHLLENGHVIRNKKGTYGRAPAHPHIAPVEAWAANDLPNRIKRELE